MDRCHREALGPARFHGLVAGLIAAAGRGRKVRFNVTDERLTSGRPLSARLIATVLDDLHPGLGTWFLESERHAAAGRRFTFSPVIVQGRCEPGAGREGIRAADLLDHPEVVLSPRSDGRVRLLTSMNAAWCERAPRALDLGDATPGGATDLLLDRLWPRVAPAARFPWLRAVAAAAADGEWTSVAGSVPAEPAGGVASLAARAKAASEADADGAALLDIIRAQTPWAEWCEWRRDPDAVFLDRAEALFALTGEPLPFTVDVVPARGDDPFTLPVLRTLFGLHARRAPHTIADTTDIWRVELLARSRRRDRQIPTHDGIPRRADDADVRFGSPAPLDRTALDTGWGLLPAESGQAHVLRWRLRKFGPSLALDLPGLVWEDARPLGVADRGTASYRRLLTYLALALGPDLFADVVAPIRAELVALLGAEVMPDRADADLSPSRLPLLADRDAVLRFLTADRRQGRTPRRNPVVEDLVGQAGPGEAGASPPRRKGRAAGAPGKRAP